MRALSHLGRGLLAALVVGAAIAASGRASRAGDDDRLVWGLGEESLRYDLEEDDSARISPEAGLAPVFARAQLASQSDFDGARRWKLSPRDVSDLVWYYALYLPFGEFPHGGTSPLHEEIKDWPWGALTVDGRDEIRRAPGNKTLLKVSVDLSQTIGGQRGVAYYDKGSTLTVESTYLEKKKLVAEAKWQLDLHLLRDGKNLLFHHEGKIVLSGKVDASQKGFLTEVQGAIRRGTRFVVDGLHKRVNAYKAGTPPSQALGHVALPTFALLRSGVPASELSDAFDFMSRCELKEVYSVSLYIMCLEARSVRRDEVPPQAGAHTVARFHKEPVPAADKREMLRAARWLVAVRKHGEGWWSYKGDPGTEAEPTGAGGGTQGRKGGPRVEGRPLDMAGNPAQAGDRSNTQFATLALHVASTSDIPIEPEVWKEIADELAQSQEPEGPAVSIANVVWSAAAPEGVAPDGGNDPFQPMATRSRDQRDRDFAEGTKARGWGYSVRASGQAGMGYGSMTGAGVSSTAIAREALRRAGKLDKDADAQTRKSLRDGIAWWVQNWTPVRNPKSNGWYFYYLYSVEKAMETAGVERLDSHDWWREGCQTILTLEDPRGKGRWCSPGSDDVEDTSFVLLFLNRATLPATITSQDQIKTATGTEDPDAWDQVYVEGTGHVRLRQVLFAVETATADLVKDRLKVAEKGYEVLDEDKRPRLVPDLLRLLGTGNKEIRKFALHALHVACGVEDEAKVRAFHARWLDLVHACEARDADSIAHVRAILRGPDATLPLKRAACIGLSRLGAVEALGDLIAELSSNDASYRRQVATTIVQLAGGEKCPYDPSGADADRAAQQAAWKAWWEKARTGLVAQQEARARVLELGDRAKAPAAEKTLRDLGKLAVPALIDGLRDDSLRKRSHALLRAITGQNLPPEPQAWRDWWSKNGSS